MATDQLEKFPTLSCNSPELLQRLPRWVLPGAAGLWLSSGALDGLVLVQIPLGQQQMAAAPSCWHQAEMSPRVFTYSLAFSHNFYKGSSLLWQVLCWICLKPNQRTSFSMIKISKSECLSKKNSDRFVVSALAGVGYHIVNALKTQPSRSCWKCPCRILCISCDDINNHRDKGFEVEREKSELLTRAKAKSPRFLSDLEPFDRH